MLKLLLASAGAAAICLGLAACSKPDATAQPASTPPANAQTGDAKAPAAPPAPSAQAISTAQAFEAVAAQGKGFSVGAVMSAHTVYVLFDPQCPHCGHLWQAALPLHSKAKFVWIPVALMNGKSAAQGAALLTAGNPVQAMTEHEKSILAGTGGMSASASIPTDIEQNIKKNTELLNSLGADSVPYIVAKNARTGQTVVNSGAMDTPALAKLIGMD
jgi:thiol:disulfide interchange protein DsbG